SCGALSGGAVEGGGRETCPPFGLAGGSEGSSFTGLLSGNESRGTAFTFLAGACGSARVAGGAISLPELKYREAANTIAPPAAAEASTNGNLLGGRGGREGTIRGDSEGASSGGISATGARRAKICVAALSSRTPSTSVIVGGSGTKASS